VILELVRIILLFGFPGSLLGFLFIFIYDFLGMNVRNNEWMVFIALFIILIVLYRNKLQFHGWYKGKGREKLPKITQVLITSATLLLVLAPFV
jgi:hypothetical protein